MIDAGENHTCAVTTDYRAFCWGSGQAGELGDGQAYISFTPRAVAGGLSFARVTAGVAHSCGETRTKQAYCWGGGGALGSGTTESSVTPVPVAGGHTFAQLSAGEFHTCGKTTGSVAYCWGFNLSGQIGNGTKDNEDHPTPSPVVGPI